MSDLSTYLQSEKSPSVHQHSWDCKWNLWDIKYQDAAAGGVNTGTVLVCCRMWGNVCSAARVHVCLQTVSAVGLLNTGHGLCLWCRYWSAHKRVLTVFGDWTKAPPRYHLHKFSLTHTNTHTHTHINMRAHRAWMEFVHNCVSGLIHLQEKKNVFFGADQHANNRGKEEKDIILCTSMTRWLCICAIVHCQLRLQHGKLFSRGSDDRRTEHNSIR